MKVTIYVDPLCPWTFITSRWLVRVAPERHLEIDWQPFSLALKNADNLSYEHMAEAQHTLSMLAVMSAVHHDAPERVGRLYYECASRIHFDKRTDDGILTESLEACDLSLEYLKAASEGKANQIVAKAMDEALALVGEDVGVPIIVLHEKKRQIGFFGPILSSVPPVKASAELWDHISWLASQPHFHEMKLARPSEPDIMSAKGII